MAACGLRHLLKYKLFTSRLHSQYQVQNVYNVRRQSSDKTPIDIIFDPDNPVEPPIPVYAEKFSEPVKVKRARLLYQSRKRGMLENGLLLSTFAAKHLSKLDEDQLVMYDRIINIPSNDWDIYHWITGAKATPQEYDNVVMDMLKNHAQNNNRESRIMQPDLYNT